MAEFSLVRPLLRSVIREDNLINFINFVKIHHKYIYIDDIEYIVKYGKNRGPNIFMYMIKNKYFLPETYILDLVVSNYKKSMNLYTVMTIIDYLMKKNVLYYDYTVDNVINEPIILKKLASYPHNCAVHMHMKNKFILYIYNYLQNNNILCMILKYKLSNLNSDEIMMRNNIVNVFLEKIFLIKMITNKYRYIPLDCFIIIRKYFF